MGKAGVAVFSGCADHGLTQSIRLAGSAGGGSVRKKKGTFMKKLIFICYSTFFLVVCSGCQTYRADLNLPENIERIQIETIKSDSAGYGQLLTDYLISELGKTYTITDKAPDIIIRGSAIQTTWFVNAEAYIIIESPGGRVGTIENTGSFMGRDTPRNFAKKIKKLLTNPR